jgi:hypothetical protein
MEMEEENNMEQTAIEWLENQIMTSKYFYSLMKEINSRGTVAQSNIFEQAKEMEKQRLKDAYAMGREGKTIAEFNETFKSE